MNRWQPIRSITGDTAHPAPVVSPAMTETDRAAALHDLDARHDELLAELETLDREVQRAIAKIRPPAAPAAPAATVGPGGPTC